MRIMVYLSLVDVPGTLDEIGRTFGDDVDQGLSVALGDHRL